MCGVGLLGVKVCTTATDVNTFIFGVACSVTGAGVVGCGGGKGEVMGGGGGGGRRGFCCVGGAANIDK